MYVLTGDYLLSTYSPYLPTYLPINLPIYYLPTYLPTYHWLVLGSIWPHTVIQYRVYNGPISSDRPYSTVLYYTDKQACSIEYRYSKEVVKKSLVHYLVLQLTTDATTLLLYQAEWSSVIFVLLYYLRAQNIHNDRCIDNIAALSLF